MPLIILLATIGIALAVILRRWYKQASKDDVRKLVLISVWTICIAGLVALVLTGRFFHALGWGLLILLFLLVSGTLGKRKRGQKNNFGGNISGHSMSLKEAFEVLGLDEKATQGDVQKAYIELIQKNHPDRGGSDYLSAKINHAHDVLMDHFENK